MNRTRLFTEKSKAEKFVKYIRENGKSAEIKEEKWIRQGIHRTEYRVNYEA